MIHLRVVSPPGITSALMPVLDNEPAVMNLTVHPGASGARPAIRNHLGLCGIWPSKSPRLGDGAAQMGRYDAIV